MFDYARYLLSDGVNVIVLTGDNNRPNPQDNWTFPPGLEVHYCRKLSGWRSPYYFDFSWTELTGFFERNWRRIDFIHLYQTRSIFNVVALWASHKYGLKIILSSFGSLPRRSSSTKFLYDLFLVRPLLRRATLLLAQTRNEFELYRSYGGRRDCIHVLPLAVDLQKRPPLHADMRGVFRDRYGIAQTAFLFVFVGRLHPLKGVDFLVNCFAEVAKAVPEAQLAIVGHNEGSLADVKHAIHIHKLQSKVILCGPLYDDHRWAAYAAADSFVILPQNYEETSLASLEALSCGIPAIVNQRAEVPWLDEYAAGRIVKAGDQRSAVAAMLDACLKPKQMLEAQRASATRLVVEKFEIGAVTRSLKLLLQSAARAAARDVVDVPLLVGPLPSSVTTSGQALCFQLLVEGLRARDIKPAVVDLGSSVVHQTGSTTWRRAAEYLVVFGKVARALCRRISVVYVTIAQSRYGFFRDAVIIGFARVCGKNVVVHLHGGNYASYYSAEPRLIQLLIRVTLRQTHAIVVLADSLRNCFAFDPALREKTRVVKNSILSSAYPAYRPNRTVRPDGEVTILYLSNLIESKGFIEVLYVLKFLHERERIPARAVFCGSFMANPSDDVKVRSADHCRQLFGEKVVELGMTRWVSYRGTVSGEQKHRVLSESDFLVFPTRYNHEGQPVVLIEALAYGLPTIATDYRANSEMVVDGETGYLIDWFDTALMAQRIATLWRDPLAYARMSADARIRFERNFSAKVHIDAMEKILFE
jgi:glycosyltransferase involved in cell wall biosynthesis